MTDPKERSGLKWILVRNAQNPVTQRAIGQALNLPVTEFGKVQDVPDWPGKVIDPTDEAFPVMLAMPNIRGVCWLLIQHQEELGHKTIDSITAYQTNTRGNYNPNILLKISDVVTAKRPPGPTESGESDAGSSSHAVQHRRQQS